MKWREFAKDYLNFSRKERIAVLFLVAALVLIILLPDIIPVNKSKNTPVDTAWFSTIRNLQIKEPATENGNTKYEDNSPSGYQFDKPKNSFTNEPEIRGELFYFDPNKATADEWKRLGIKDKTAQTIQNYLSKGGKFRKPEDFQKIYGLQQNIYERLAPYIRIEQTETEKSFETYDAVQKNSFTQKVYAAKYFPVEINTADTAAFISLPGIGSKLATRIINFRDKLGGFYSVDQVGETYGLPDSTFQKIKQWLKLENNSVKKININTATVDELKAHPYIKFSLANPIVAYRNEHGLFSKLEDIKKIMAVTDEVYKKMAPYLTIQ